MQALTVLVCRSSERLEGLLDYALAGIPAQRIAAEQVDFTKLQNQKIIFACAVDSYGMGQELCVLLRGLRQHPDCLEGTHGALIMDGAGEEDTKLLARMLVYAANEQGCLFPGKALVEGTGSLHNLDILSHRTGLPREEAYLYAARQLVERLLQTKVEKKTKPRMLMLHASDQTTSNTLALGQRVLELLGYDSEVLSLRNGTVQDCRGCSYKVCSHFAKTNSCFYGGVLNEDVFPRVLQADALLLLCPNYNDAIGANITAFINRLTGLLVNNTLEGKALYGIVVSGYSGGDLVAQQLMGALCLNKALLLPPRFCLLETANDPGSAQTLPGIEERLEAFAQRIRRQLSGEEKIT